MPKLHNIQKVILEIGNKEDISKLSLRELGEKIEEQSGEKAGYRQKVKHHLDQLKKKGLLHYNPESGALRSKSQQVSQDRNGLVSIPIVGAANCGNATIVAQQDIEGYLKISSSLIKPKKSLFAVRAIGNSMNNAFDLDGGPIEDGDYVVIDREDIDIEDGDYVLSIIDGLANIKMIRIDKARHIIALLSKSKDEYAPIYIHEEDLNTETYLINGKVVRVVKQIH